MHGWIRKRITLAQVTAGCFTCERRNNLGFWTNRGERHGLMCKGLYFDALCVAQQYTEFLPYCSLSLSTIYSISFQKKRGDVPFSFQFSRFNCNYVEAQSVTWSVSIIFHLLISLVLSSSLHLQSRLSVSSLTDAPPAVMFLPHILHLFGREMLLLCTSGGFDACERLDLHSCSRKIQRKHLSTLFKEPTVRMSLKPGKCLL